MAVRANRGAGYGRAARGGAVALASWRPAGLRAAALALLYAAAGVAATWPAVRSFGSAYIADGAPGFGETAAGDHLQTVYRFWLVGHQLEHGAAPWRDPYSFQPLVEPQVALAGWPFGFPFWPLEAAFGPVVAWNVLLLGGIVAAGLLTYGWLRALEVRAAAAAVGGLAFAIAPYRIQQSGGHLLGWIAILLPLCLLAIERSRSAESHRAAHAWGAVAAVSLASIPLSGQVHLALGAIPFVLGYALARYRRLPLVWTLAGAVAAVGIGLAIRFTIIAGSIEAGGRSLAEVELFQADWLDLVSRTAPRPGDVFASERYVFLGWLLPLLGAVGLVALARARRGRLAAVLGLAVVVPVLLAVGTNFPFYEALWDALPPFRFPRVPERLLPVADLALAGLAAFGLALLLSALRGRAVTAAAAVAVALVAADLTTQPLRASAADTDNAAYDDPGAGRLLELPLFEPGIHFGSVYLAHGLQTPRERPGGYSTLAPADAFDFFFRLNRLSCGIWLPGDREELEGLGVGPVFFHAGLYEQSRTPGAWFAWRALQDRGYRAAARDGRVARFERHAGARTPPPVPEPPRGRPVFCEGWERFSMVERQAPLWVYGGGTLGLTVTASRPTGATVWVDGRVVERAGVAARRAFELDLAGERWHWVMLEIPRLLGTDPPQGLRLERLVLPG